MKTASNNDSSVLQKLIVDVVSGDAQAQKQFVTRYRPFVQRSIRERFGRTLRTKEETQDLEQNVFITILGSLSHQKWQGQQAFLGWLRHIIRGAVVDSNRYFSAKKRAAVLETQEDRLQFVQVSVPRMESAVDRQRDLEELRELLTRLPEKQAQAIVLFHKGHSHAEIGRLLNCSAEAARKLLSRGRAKIIRWREGPDALEE